MFIDKRLEFSDAQAVTADAASTNVIDLVQDRDVGAGKPIFVVVSVDVALAGTTPTFAVQVQTDDNSAFSSATTILISETFSALAAGTQIVLALGYTNERYLRLNYDVGGTTPTITVSAWLTDQEPRKITAYPDATN